MTNHQIGIVPEANWRLIAKSNATSRVWYHEDNRGGFTFTWQDVLFNRDSNQPISFQAEINPNGLLTYRYDLSQADSLSLNNFSSGIATAPCRHCEQNFSSGIATAPCRYCEQNFSSGIATAPCRHCEEHHAHGAGCDVAISCERGAELSANCPLNSSITSVGWYRIQPEDLITDDRDGDALTTRDEVCTHFTAPSLPDTDCDGLADGEEITRATNPLIADTDGDGLVDGSDPEPLVATSLADIDCDGIADAYENYWFGDTNACNTVTNRDETGFTLSFAPVVYEQRESESTLSSIIARAARELRKDR